jgi:DNA-binding CsgD family transcriptional regulator
VAGQPRRQPLIGRGAQLNELVAALDRAAGSSGGIAFVEGEAGIGKTFLLEEALGRARTMGFRCFTGGAEELERHRPFGVIAEALGVGRRGRRPGIAYAGENERRAWVAKLVGGEDLPRTDTLTGGAEFRIVDALLDFVEHLSAGGPVVVALEDLQWSDPSTLLALNRLGREISRLPVALIATLRPMPRSSNLQALLDGLTSRNALRLTLSRLDDGSMAALVEAIIGMPPGPGLLAQLARAGGNPFFASELVGSLQRDGAITESHGRAEVDSVALAPSLTSAVMHRLSFLSEEALETLQVASILGSTFSVADLATATGRRVPALTPVLSAAVRAGILGEDGSQLAFCHDLIREVLYQEMPPTLRGWLHLAAAHVLTQSGRSADELAEHVVRGALPGDIHAVEWLRTAARQAATRSPTVAADLLQQALELAPATDPHRDAALTDLAMYRLRSGHPADAESICREVLGRAHDRSVAARLRQALVEAAVGQGRVGDGLREAERGANDDSLPPGDRARLWAWSSTCRAMSWDLPGAVVSANRALQAAEEAGDDVGAGVALENLAVGRYLGGNFPEALQLAGAGLQRLALGPAAPSHPTQPILNLAAALMNLDAVEAAQDTLQHWRRFRDERGATGHPADHFITATGSFWSGDWDGAIRALSAGRDLAEITGIRRGSIAGHSLRSLIALHRGDLAGAEREVAAAEMEAANAGLHGQPDWMIWARALLLEAQGRRDEALSALTGAWNLCTRTGVVAGYPVIGPDLVRLAIAGNDMSLADDVARAVEGLAATAGVASVEGAALRCRAMASADAGVALEAVAAFRRSPRRRDLALALEDAAVALATGQVSCPSLDPRPLAREAVEIFRSMDASGDTARARARLRGLWEAAMSEERRPRGVKPKGKPGFWESLTEAECRVAWLVAEGMSNPDIARRLGISKRTVQTHVSHALEKLGLTSRVELAVKAAGVERPDGRSAVAGSGA